MKVTAIIQARMNSSRLPGKVLLPLCDATVLEFLYNRLSKSKLINNIIIATTENEIDNSIIDLCKEKTYPYFRGSEKNVISRYEKASKKFNSDIIVRITADCPFVDPDLVDDCINKLVINNLDYVSNCNNVKKQLPDGFDVEVFTKKALDKAIKLSISSAYKEHVTFAFFKTKIFKTSSVEYEHNFQDLRVTLDYEQDYELIYNVAECISNKFADWRTISNYIANNPEIKKLNVDIVRNASWDVSLKEDGVANNISNERSKLIANGSGLLSKRADQFAPEIWPENYLKAKGQVVYTSDDKIYLDYSIGGIGATTLGFACDEVDKEVIKQVKNGSASSLNSQVELECTKKLKKAIPWIENARYTRSGGEANALSIRIARSATGRDRVLFSGYHGWHDWYLSAAFEHKMGNHLLDDLPISGVPKALAGTAIPFDYGNHKQFLDLIEEYEDLAAVILEPMRYTLPNISFLNLISQECKKRGIILIFDEISCGFRFNNSAVHLDYDIIPDMVVLSKAIGNGYAIGCVAGSETVMRASKNSFISSTTHTESIGFAAMSSVLDIYARSDVSKKLAKCGGEIKKILQKTAIQNDIKIEINGLDQLWSWSFKLDKEKNRIYQSLTTQLLLSESILFCNRFYSTLGIDPDFYDYFETSLNKVFVKISDIMKKEKNPENFLVGPPNRLGIYS